MAQKEKSKRNKDKWTKMQLFGFWSLVVILVSFWSGVSVGKQAAIQSQTLEAQVKSQAVEAYKAELKTSE